MGGGGSGKPTFADMGEGGVKNWEKLADVLNGRPLTLYIVLSSKVTKVMF